LRVDERQPGRHDQASGDEGGETAHMSSLSENTNQSIGNLAASPREVKAQEPPADVFRDNLETLAAPSRSSWQAGSTQT
jgi:hypothetical protein